MNNILKDLKEIVEVFENDDELKGIELEKELIMSIFDTIQGESIKNENHYPYNTLLVESLREITKEYDDPNGILCNCDLKETLNNLVEKINEKEYDFLNIPYVILDDPKMDLEDYKELLCQAQKELSKTDNTDLAFRLEEMRSYLRKSVD